MIYVLIIHPNNTVQYVNSYSDVYEYTKSRIDITFYEMNTIQTDLLYYGWHQNLNHYIIDFKKLSTNDFLNIDTYNTLIQWKRFNYSKNLLTQ